MNKHNYMYLLLLLITIIMYILINIYDVEKYISDELYNFDDNIDRNNIDNNKYIINRDNDNEFNTILKNININKYYQNIILITSKIITINSHYNTIYSVSERFDQTKKTIMSIKQHIPNVCIVLLDNSDFSNNIYIKNEIIKLCDVFINPIMNDELNNYTNNYPYKGISEAYQIIYFLDILSNLDLKYDNLFKISGRYILNDNFNINIFNNNNIIFKQTPKSDDPYSYYTSFYKIPYNKIALYINAYKLIHNNIKKDIVNTDIEVLLPILIKLENIQSISEIGLTQSISSGDFPDKYI